MPSMSTIHPTILGGRACLVMAKLVGKERTGRMEVEVRVVRARVWLASSLFLDQDGFLSLTRVGGSEHVAHAAIRAVEGKSGDQYSIADATRLHGQHKCFRSVTLAWEEQGAAPGTSCLKFALPETRIVKKTNQQAVLPRLDFQLFMLRPRSRVGASARSRPQLLYVGASGWQLSEKDLKALVSSREVVFLTTLQDELGTLEVKLRCVSSNEPNSAAGIKALQNPNVEDEAEVPTGFSINWSSSAALRRDIAEKARLKAKADKKLIVQLKQTATKAANFFETRDYLLVHLRRSRAASRIQRKFRALQRKKQEEVVRLRQEEEARVAEKKARVREKVMARNRQRALALRARLLGQMNNNQTLFSANNTEAPMPFHESMRIAEHVEAERAKLKKRLAVLEVQRKQLTTNKRSNAITSNQLSPQQQTDKLFDNELVRAVQQLHVTRTYSNQM